MKKIILFIFIIIIGACLGIGVFLFLNANSKDKNVTQIAKSKKSTEHMIDNLNSKNEKPYKYTVYNNQETQQVQKTVLHVEHKTSDRLVYDNNVTKGSTGQVQNLSAGESYLEGLNNLNAYTTNLRKKCNGSSYEIITCQEQVYSLWNGKLNQIYQDIKISISPGVFDKLQREEVEWIQNKNEKGKEYGEASQHTSSYSDGYYNEVNKLTEQRCYYLVNKYFN